MSGNDWSLKGYQATKPVLYFDFIPFDFDASTIDKSFEFARRFVDWVIEQGIPETHFSIWLSGSKGFHIELDRAAFDLEYPSDDVLRRVKPFIERTAKKLNIPCAAGQDGVDPSLYSAGRLYRNHNSKHAKTGLYKTRIALADFTLDHIQRREEWANGANVFYNEFNHTPLEAPIHLPLSEPENVELALAPDMVVDTGRSILANCPKIRGLMTNPEGRELRRQAAGILMEAYGAEDAAEVTQLYEAWEKHPHMDPGRWADADKWRDEFSKDGYVKCNKTCTGMGCERSQKQICGTQVPADHLVKADPIKPIPVDEARGTLREKFREAVYREDRAITALDMPIGLGKTTEVITVLAEDTSLSAFYVAPTHNLVTEIVQKMIDAGIDSIRVLRSRKHLIDQRLLECNYPLEVRTSDEVTHKTTKNVCMKCPKFPQNAKENGEPEENYCTYFQQFDGVKEVRVVVGAHQHVNPYILKMIGMENRSFLLIDESPIKSFSNQIQALSMEQLAALQGFYDKAVEVLEAEMSPAPAGPGEAIPEQPGMFGTIRYLTAKAEAEEFLKIAQADAEAVQYAQMTARGVMAAVGLIIFGKDLDEKHLEYLRTVKYRTAYTKFVNKLAEVSKYGPTWEMDAEFRYVGFPDLIENALMCADVGIPYDTTKNIFFSKLMPECKTIILDATSSRPLYERMVKVCNKEEREFHYHTVPLVEQTHAEVIQVTNSGYSKTRISSTDEMMERLLFIPRSLAATYEDDSILCVSVMDLQASIKDAMPKKRTRTEHFGDTRGKDEYRDFPIEVIIGGFFVSNAAIVEGLQRLGFYKITDEVLEDNTIQVRYKHIAKNGDTYFSKRKAFKSVYGGDAFYYANLLMEQASLSEVVQATRVRLFSGMKNKRVYILTNVGLQRMYSDRFVTIEQLTAELEDESGLKSDLDTSRMRRDGMMLARLARIDIGAEFTYTDLHKDAGTARHFLRGYISHGIVSRVPGRTQTYQKLAEIDDNSVTAKNPKEQARQALEKWFAGLPNGKEFTNLEASDAAGTESVHLLKKWLQDKIENHQLITIGEKRYRRYRKVQKLTENITRILDATK